MRKQKEDSVGGFKLVERKRTQSVVGLFGFWELGSRISVKNTK